MAVLIGGCASPAERTRGLDSLADPEAVLLDEQAPSYSWASGDGSLLLGAGWGPQEAGEGRPWAWAIAEEATLWFRRPAGRQFDFVARVKPFSFPGAGRQRLGLELGGRRVGSAGLRRGWRQIRIRLPAAALTDGLNRITLRFAYAVRPRDVLRDSRDIRRLAAAFRFVAVVPRGASPVLAAARWDRAAGPIDLPPGATLSIPLPAAAQVAGGLEGVQLGTAAAALEVEAVGPGGDVERIAQATPGGPPPRFSFETSGSGIHRLRFRVVPAAGARPSGGGARLRLAALPLSVRRRPLPAAVRSPDVFLYVVDTLRADALSPYGAKAGLSPRLSEFAREAVVYADAWTASSWTLPATVSVLTGTLPDRHGVMKGDRKFSDSAVPSLATLLAGRGYDTVGVSQSFVASSHFGVDKGFGHFFLDDHLNAVGLASGRVRRYLLTWLLARGTRQAPIFAYLHTVDPHAPYAPPEGFRHLADAAPGRLPPEKYHPLAFSTDSLGEDPREVAHLRALYQGEVLHADREFGRFVDLLKRLELYEDSIVAFLSDHGEEFGEHGGFDHGRTVYEEMLRIPLIVKYPRGTGAGTRAEARVSAVDLAATVLELAGGAPAGLLLDGRALPRGATRAATRPIYSAVHPAASEFFGSVDYRAVALGSLKCVESRDGLDQYGDPIPPLRAFDLGSDRGERAPHTAGAAVESCRRLLAAWPAAGAPRAALAATPPETLDQLRTLGYVE